MRGRLTRRDYALTIGALCGGASLLSFAAVSTLLPLTYFTATAFFREESAAFWILLIAGLALIFLLASIFLPPLAIPATVRRLHDIGHGGWLAFPLILVSLVALGLPILFLAFLGALIEGMKRVPDLTVFDSPDEMGFIFGTLVFLYAALCLVSFVILSVYGGWIFLKKGMPVANRYGEPPVEETIPSVRAAFLSSTGTIARRPFVLRSLIVLAAAGIIVPTAGQTVLYPLVAILDALHLVLAAAGIIVPTAGQTVLYPLVAILDALHLVPAGADFFTLFIGGTVYPLATLPLILRRLHTLGRAKWEAVIVYAALLPNVIATAHTAHIFGKLALLDGDELGDIIIDEILTISTVGDTAFIALWVLCAVLSLVGVVRLLRA